MSPRAGPEGRHYGDRVCGRFTSRSSPTALVSFLGVEDVVAPDLGARFNVAPTDEVYAVAVRAGRRTLGTVRWGLVPSWSESPAGAARMINARAETVATTPAFRDAFRRRRCIVPADGFYEWVRTDDGRQAYHLHRADGRPLAFAGVWDSWRDRRLPDGERRVTCAIVTTRANESVRPVHDRMPVVLAPTAWEAWLEPSNDDLGELESFLVPAPDDLLAVEKVGRRVNDVRNDGPDLVVPVPT
jgi:putative SOS response-associated peptidase YedK